MQQNNGGTWEEHILEQDLLSSPPKPLSLGIRSTQISGEQQIDRINSSNATPLNVNRENTNSTELDNSETNNNLRHVHPISSPALISRVEFFALQHYSEAHGHGEEAHHHEAEDHEHGEKAHYHAVEAHEHGEEAHHHEVEAHEHEEEVGFELFQAPQGWTSTATNGGGLTQGQPITLTWSIAADDTPIPGFMGEPAVGSNLQATLGTIYDNGNGIDDEKDIWLPIITSVFDRWSELGGVNFVYEPQDDGGDFSDYTHVNPGVIGTRGDIRLGGHPIDGDYGTLGYNFSPDVGDMILDTNDAAFSDNKNNTVWLRNLIAHELGHGLGFFHLNSTDAQFLLEPFISTSFDGPQLDDILGLHRLYGDALESANGMPTDSNDTIASATDLGLLNVGDSVARGSDASDVTTVVTPQQTDFISIDDDSDIDIFRFTINTPVEINVELNPRGATYDQDGSPLNTKALSDLSLSLLGANGNVLTSSNQNGIGIGENITNFQLSSAGDYFLQITGADNNVQLYELGLSLAGLTFSGGDAADTLTGSEGNDTILGGGGRDLLYGAAGNDSILGGADNDIIRGSNGIDTLDGGSGTDILDYVYSNTGVNVNLLTGVTSGGYAQGDSITNFERVYGSRHDDLIIGNNGRNYLIARNGNDTLRGGQDNDTLRGLYNNNDLGGEEGNDLLYSGIGLDTLDGGSGTDILDYVYSSTGVNVNLLTGVTSGGYAQGDSITNFERVYGSRHDDSIMGDDGRNLLIGRNGNDTLRGGQDNDTLRGLYDNNHLSGEDGNDLLYGGIGIDTLDGGSGTDILDYVYSNTGVSVNLLTGTTSGGYAQGDSITNFERVYGSRHDDSIMGDGGRNLLIGRNGNDTLRGGQDNDTLRGLYDNNHLSGEDGNDLLYSGIGIDTLDGGSGTDILDYVYSNTGVSVNLLTGTTSGGYAQGDSITNFERVYGSRHDDSIMGDDGRNLLIGRNGNDTLRGGQDNDTLRGLYDNNHLSGEDGNDLLYSGIGIDTLDGGSGTDILDYVYSNTGVSVNLLTGTTSGGYAQGDSITNFERVYGSRHDDSISGDNERNYLIGRNGNDTLQGGQGADTLFGGEDADQFKFETLNESQLSGIDWIRDLAIGIDHIVGPTPISSNSIDHLGAVLNLSEASIHLVLTNLVFESDSAATFTYGTRTYLALNDQNAGFQASDDSILNITGYSGSLASLEVF